MVFTFTKSPNPPHPSWGLRTSPPAPGTSPRSPHIHYPPGGWALPVRMGFWVLVPSLDADPYFAWPWNTPVSHPPEALRGYVCLQLWQSIPGTPIHTSPASVDPELAPYDRTDGRSKRKQTRTSMAARVGFWGILLAGWAGGPGRTPSDCFGSSIHRYLPQQSPSHRPEWPLQNGLEC